jgi:hypothetical protein
MATTVATTWRRGRNWFRRSVGSQIGLLPYRRDFAKPAAQGKAAGILSVVAMEPGDSVFYAQAFDTLR